MKKLFFTTVATMSLYLTTAQIPNYVPTNGLVSAYTFTGNADNVFGNGSNGITNNVLLTDDRFGNSNNAYEFNGINSNIDLGINPGINSILSDFTISFWVYKTNSSSGTVVSSYSSQNGSFWRFASHFLTDSLSSGFLVGGSAGTWNYSNVPVNTINLNNWVNVTIVRNNTNLETYINGILSNIKIVSNSSLNNPTIPNATTKIGCNFPSSTWFFNGKIDDLFFYDRALSQQEISDLYNYCQVTSISFQPTNQTVNINNSAQFVVSSSEPSAVYQWQTDLGVGFQNLSSVGQYSGTTNDTLVVSSVTINNNNQHFRCIVSSGLCSDTSNIAVLLVNNNVGLLETPNKKLYNICPNPTSGSVILKVDAELIGNNYSVCDYLGRTVLFGKINSENTSIELGNLSVGLYTFNVGENMKQSFKITKE